MTRPCVLLVDDEDGLRTTLAANLELDGFEVVEAADGAEALEHAERRSFDLVVTDIRMPGMNGVELFRAIRRLHPRVPVVLMTAFALEHLIQQALREGVYVVMSKPFDVEHAMRTLHAALDRPLLVLVEAPAEVAATTRALEALGIAVQAPVSADAALDLVRAGRVGACVVDLGLPGVDGPALIEHIRRIDADVVVLALSSQDVDSLLQRAAVHAAAILRRPVAPGDLVEALARARARAQPRRR